MSQPSQFRRQGDSLDLQYAFSSAIADGTGEL
jgi:hypothetical protein